MEPPKDVHISVLKKEVLEHLKPKSNENFIDCTIGGGGHAIALLEENEPRGKVLGIDWDKEIIHFLNLFIHKSKFKNRLILVNDSFTNLKRIVGEQDFQSVSGILFDLGMASWHLEKSKRGFSFLRNERLDMRYSLENVLKAEEILNLWPESDIEKILKNFGEERFARKITKEIIKERKQKPIETTFQLIEIIKRAVPVWYRKKKIHFATRTFLALRITVNDELNNLKRALPQALEILKNQGRLVVISFHSLEDRIVKNFFKREAKKNQIKILTKKPIRPKREEIKRNPRSRSSKLRAAIKLTSNI